MERKDVNGVPKKEGSKPLKKTWGGQILVLNKNLQFPHPENQIRMRSLVPQERKNN
mgnify:CR=1 FL=1